MRLPLVLCLLLAPGLASASVTQLSLDLAKPNAPAQIQAIQKAVQGDSNLSEMSADDRNAVLRMTAEIGADLDATGALDIAAKDQALIDQAKINELLTKGYADSKMICHAEAKTGSNRLERICITTAAHRRQYEQTQNQALRNTGPGVGAGSGNQ